MVINNNAASQGESVYKRDLCLVHLTVLLDLIKSYRFRRRYKHHIHDFRECWCATNGNKLKKKEEKKNERSNSVKSLLFCVSVSWPTRECFLFSYAPKSSSVLIFSGSVQHPRAISVFLKLFFCNNPNSSFSSLTFFC